MDSLESGFDKIAERSCTALTIVDFTLVVDNAFSVICVAFDNFPTAA
jgi:hypothetical protein